MPNKSGCLVLSKCNQMSRRIWNGLGPVEAENCGQSESRLHRLTKGGGGQMDRWMDDRILTSFQQ